MKKRRFVLHSSVAAALCAVALTAPAAADDGPKATTPPPHITPVVSSPRALAPFDAFVEYARAITTAQKAQNDIATAPAAAPSSTPEVTTAIPPRAAAVARSYPRSFSTYDQLVDYASSVAAAQQASNDHLAAVLAREDLNRAQLATVFDPRIRGGLLQSPGEVMDNAAIRAVQAQLANDVNETRQLVADGAVATTSASWRLPVLGEDSQDFGPTPYYFEPALTYEGVYYRHFHAGTDIATAWGTPVVAPAAGLVVFAGTMSDGAEVVVLAHDSGLVSLYAHLDNRVFPVTVKAGDVVAAGAQIGNVGLTGMTTGAHLHWSVWRNGVLVDPLSMIGG